MATGYGATPALRLKRSSQSGSKAMTAVWQTIYEESSNDAFLFWAGLVDLTNLQAGDTLNIKFSKKVGPDENYIVFDQTSYSGDEIPTEHKSIKIGHIPNTYGVKIELQQSAGVLRDLYCEFYDAKRLGAG